MKTKKVTRHFCDHCGKGSFQSPAMMRHESICFRNPKRACFLCESEAPDMEWIISSLKFSGMEHCRIAAKNCPACILSAILLSRPKHPVSEEYVDFDYKKEKAAWSSAQNREFRDSVFNPLP